MLPGTIFLVVLFIVPLTGLLLLSFGMPNWSLAKHLRIGDGPAYFIMLRNTASGGSHTREGDESVFDPPLRKPLGISRYL